MNAMLPAISPLGHVYLRQSEEAGEPLPKEAARRIAEAFAKGPAEGLLHLGASEVETRLPPAFAFFRDVGRLYMTRLCAVPDLADRRANATVTLPEPEISRLILSVPPIPGAEYLTLEVVQDWVEGLNAVVRRELSTFTGDVRTWLAKKSSLWSLVGRVHFHLAENKGNAASPFAFLATFTNRLGANERLQHVPLGRALRESASAKDRDLLLSLLSPVQKAAERSAFLRSLVDSSQIYEPLAWSPENAYAFLKEIPLYEESGIVVRVPDWWSGRRARRPEVRVTIGSKGTKGALGLEGLLDFSVDLSLDGETLTEKDWREILASTAGLTLIKGKWVEIDREKLKEVLAHWQKASRAARDGVSFAEGMRLLSGIHLDSGPGGRGLGEGDTEHATWTSIVPGEWLSGVLERLRAEGEADPGDLLRGTLRHYQRAGVKWLLTLATLGLGGCLADDMGLGKTVQVISLILLLKRNGERGTALRGPHLLVLPASLLANWKAELERFAPSLRVFIAHPSAGKTPSSPPDTLPELDVVLTSYGSVSRYSWLGSTPWGLVVLDEAQAIKNPAARQTKAAKALKSRVRFALTGTPVENRLSDLWSIFDFTCPGLLGSAPAFSRLAKRLTSSDHPDFGPLRRLVKPYILRRLKTDRSLIQDLPDKTEIRTYCPLTKAQAALYQQSVDELKERLENSTGIARRGLVLAFLLRFKQICNHPSHWLADGRFAPEDSGKFNRLTELVEEIAARQQKVLVFTQFREMTEPLSRFLAKAFGAPGLVLHGSTEVAKRPRLVEDFQREGGPPFFVLSIKAGGVGLNLTAASHVIHFDRWWNPAVENQATDRAYRIGQKKNVLVHKFVCRGTVEERIDALIEEKTALARGLLEGGAEVLLTEMKNDELVRLVSLDLATALAET